MNRLIKKIGILSLGALTLASCGDPMEEITSYVLERDLAPVNFEATSIEETSVELEWVASEGAGSYILEIYENDSLEFNSDKLKHTITVNSSQSPATIGVTIENLYYDTKYSARVMAKDSADASRDSKWSYLYFRTSAQQLLKAPAERDIQDRTVTLTLDNSDGTDLDFTRIVIQNEAGQAVVTHELTNEEKVAGVLEISGLTPETKYSAYLYNGEKQRGHREFTTIIDLNGAIAVGTPEELVAAIESEELADGAVIALYGGTYTVPSAEDSTKGGSIVVSKNISIKGIYPTNRPVIQCYFQIMDGGQLSFSQVVLDGANNASTDQAFVFKSDGAEYGGIRVEDSEIKGYVKGVFYLNVAAVVNDITFNNCLIHDIICDGGDLFDSRTGAWNTFNLTNSTIYNSAASRDIIRGDNSSESVTASFITTVDHCTFYNVGNGDANRNIFYIRYEGNTNTFTNNVVANFNNKRGFSNQSSTGEPKFENNYYYNCLNLMSLATGNTQAVKFFDTNGTTLSEDPFADAENFDFTISGNNVVGAGDPRWLPAR